MRNRPALAVVHRRRAGRREHDDRATDRELRGEPTAKQRADTGAGGGGHESGARAGPRTDGGGRGGGTARVSDACGRGRVGCRPVPEDRDREPRAGRDREHGRERLALGGERELEVAAARAQPQVPAQRPAAQFAAARDGQLFADLQAGRAERVAVGEQRAARLVDERLDLAHLAPNDRRDRGVGQVVELGQQQRRALVLGQPADAGDELAQILAAGDLLRQPLKRRRLVVAGIRSQPTPVARRSP